MTVPDSIGPLARAKQAVIVGDSKQMPPTNFFPDPLKWMMRIWKMMLQPKSKVCLGCFWLRGSRKNVAVALP